MNKTNITNKIFLLEFDSSVEAAKTFLRFQEHYESPEFKGKIFSLKDYIKWYKTQTDNGKFTYYYDWSGFNIPSWVLEPFKKNYFRDLSTREKALLKMFENETGGYYIIGVQKGKADDLKHEIMHGLYYINPDYKKTVDIILADQKSLPSNNLTEIYDVIEKAGYHGDVLHDEVHAYLVTCQEYLEEEGVDLFPYKQVIYSLDRNYVKHTRQHANIPTVS